MTKTVMLIHGAWLTPAAWEKFRGRYEAKGYTVVAPPWPLEDVPIEQLRRSPHPDLGKTTITKIVDHYDKLIRALPEPPIIMGHSFGGIFMQLLLDRGLGAAGVGVDPGPVRGVIPRPRTLLSALPVFVAWRGWSRVLSMTFKQFATNFAQKLPAAEMRPTYDRYIVPTPGRIYFQGAVGIGAGINAKNPDRAPLLLIVGEKDRIISPSTVEANYRKQRHAPSVTAFKMFPGRSHFIFAEKGWEEVADYAIEWASKHARQTAPQTSRKEALRAVAAR
jgi:pimeloyl-ACP methyl ester carboxylesterase